MILGKREIKNKINELIGSLRSIQGSIDFAHGMGDLAYKKVWENKYLVAQDELKALVEIAEEKQVKGLDLDFIKRIHLS